MARGRSRADEAVEADDAPALERRIDKWLWYTRLVKSRTLAQTLVTAGKVRVNRIKLEKPGATVKIGDVVTLSAHARVRILKVVATGVRRGPASEAQALYEDLTPPPPPREVSERTAAPGLREPGAGRPTKRDRRRIDRMRDDPDDH
jgi:ribosome-associated heat shock protein Hsp15